MFVVLCNATTQCSAVLCPYGVLSTTKKGVSHVRNGEEKDTS